MTPTCQIFLIRGVFTLASEGKDYGPRRDKDIPALLLRSVGSLGFFGSDTYRELDERVKSQLAFEPLIQTDINFVLAAKSDQLDNLAEAIRTGQGLTVATSNPLQTCTMSERIGFSLAEIIELKGGVEATIDDIPDVDAIVDIFDTGSTLEANNLVPFACDIERLTIGAAWRKSP